MRNCKGRNALAPTPSSEPKGEREESFLWDEENRLLAVNNNGSVSCYFYDASGERTVKLTSESEMVHVNGKKVGGNDNICKFTAYVSPYFVVSNGGAYTKHIYAASQRIASKLGNEDGFGADPRRVEQAGGLKKTDNLATTIKARYESLGIDYEEAKKEEVLPDSTMDSEEPENLVFFYHPDHLGSTSYVTDADGNIAQHIEYIPYGEVFVEERNNSFSTNFLFNAKELDNETGLYYYGARYLDPTGAMWLSVDPLFEKYAGMSPYNYCAGNPVKLVDPDGREVTDEFNSLLKSEERIAAEKLKDPFLSDKERREYESVFTEAEKLRKSDQWYHVAYDDLSKLKYTQNNGNVDYPALTMYDPDFKHDGKKVGCVVIMMNNKEEIVEDHVKGIYYRREIGRIQDFAHEAKHCYQFEMGFHSFNSNGYSGLLYDYTDEEEAHYRGFLFGADNKKPNSGYNKLERKSLDLNDDIRRKQFLILYERQNNPDYFRYNGKTYKPNRAR